MLEQTTNFFRKAFFALFCAVLCTLSVMAQSVERRGRITDAAPGEARQGVTVSVKGSRVTTQTAGAGACTMDAPQGAVLVFTSVGDAVREVTVGARNTVDVALGASDNLLDDLVVVGCGSRRGSDITGSVASVPNERLSKLPVNNV